MKDFKNACFERENVLLIVKSFDYDCLFGIFLPALPPQRGGDPPLIFSVTSKFTEIAKERLVVCENGVIVGAGSKLVIKNECCVDACNLGSKRLTGADKFQVDEMEAYQLIITQSMQ